jgi:hypothetical protein
MWFLKRVGKWRAKMATYRLGACEGFRHHRRHADALEAIVSATTGELPYLLQLSREHEGVDLFVFVRQWNETICLIYTIVTLLPH